MCLCLEANLIAYVNYAYWTEVKISLFYFYEEQICSHYKYVTIEMSPLLHNRYSIRRLTTLFDLNSL